MFRIPKSLKSKMVLAHTIEDPEGYLEKSHKPELADIFREFGDDYRKDRLIPLVHHKVMRAVTNCRTSNLGGHMKKCSSCGYEHPTYNSCGNRHCPKCQSLAKFRWVKKRKEELLPVDYFHNVFTLPHDLNGIAGSNKKVIYDILFKSVSQTLLEFGQNSLGGKIGFLAILHTWDQKLAEHIHLHCIIPAGALSADKRWIRSANDNFLFSVKALSKVFRGKFTGYLKKAYSKGDLTFAGKSTEYEAKEGFKALIDELYSKKWIVYCKKPFAGGTQVLDYLSRYIFRTAISNERIKGVAGGRITFAYRDRRDNNRKKEIALSADEFIRKYLAHVLPNSYMRIRHFGFLSNRSRKVNIMLVKKLLGVSSIDTGERSEQSMEEIMLELTGKDISRCPRCKVGIMALHYLIPGFNRRTGRNCRGP
jgi:predicted Zn-ribbon and HTH transcriptional regulator